ncbi:MAG: M48 family metallopeptidase [Chloroflexi bacterium]|nr:M48 family metallopeptidase [Chloroflexota bacterium]
MEELKLDPQRQQKAKAYARIQRRFMVLDLLLGGLYALAWLILGWSVSLKATLFTFITHDWLLVAGFIAVFGGIYYLIGLPLSYLTGFTLPHRFEMSNQTIKGWISDQIKGLLLGAVLGGLALEIIYAVLRKFPDTWWLWAAGIMLIFSVILANLAPVLLLPIFYKIEPLGEEHSELINRLTNLAENANTRVQGIFKFDISRRSKAANAALTGLGNTRRIILGDTLLDEFSTDEIETVIAHELGHHVHNDIPIGIAIESIFTLGGFYLASLGLNWGVRYFGLAGTADISTFPLFLLVLGAYGLVTMPLGNAFSRYRERRADEYALRATEKGGAYAAAMTRLANQNLADADPEPWVEWLLYSHPALSKRIKMATTFKDMQ